MSSGYMVGRSAFSDEAKLWHMELASHSWAFVMLMAGSYSCVKNIVEKTGYDQLSRFYNWLTRVKPEDVETLIKKHKSWAYINYSGMDEEQFRKELLSYPKPAIEGSMRNIAKKKVKSILAEDFLELCRETLFNKLDAECHKESDWYGRLPVLDVVTTTECPHHCDDAYCYLIKFIRDSDPMTDPMPQDTLENIMEWASAIELELEQELMNG